MAFTARNSANESGCFFAGLLCAFAACLRIQLLPALLFAMIYFCYPRWRSRIPAVAAGAAIPVLLFGAVDWMTWSYPWQSFLLYYKANTEHNVGREFWSQPWYWYALVLLVLIGPAVLLLFHGARRSPFLAIFCVIVVVSHSVIPHKEIRFIYPILAPALTLAAMGMVDLLHEIKGGMRFLENPRWVIAISVAFFLGSSALLAAQCADWYKTRWGAAAFDRLSREPALCGIGLYGVIWWESGGYTHLHRDVPIIPLDNAAADGQRCSRIQCAHRARDIAKPSSRLHAISVLAGSLPVSAARQPALPPPADEELNVYLRKIQE